MFFVKRLDLCLAAALLALFVSVLPKEALGQEKEQAERLITGLARALTEFPATRDVNSVLRFYPEDYSGINDGEKEDHAGIKKKFTGLKDDMDRGVSLKIDYKVSNIEFRHTGEVAWATFDFHARLGKGIFLRKDEQGKCTAILRPAPGGFAFRHLHCSTK